MVEKLTHLLDHLSTPQTARQGVRKTAEGKREYVEFRDTSWPAWATMAWVQDGGHFVVTFGPGAMEHYLAGRPAGGAPWIETVAAVDGQAERLGLTGKAILGAGVCVRESVSGAVSGGDGKDGGGEDV